MLEVMAEMAMTSKHFENASTMDEEDVSLERPREADVES